MLILTINGEFHQFLYDTVNRKDQVQMKVCGKINFKFTVRRLLRAE